MMDPRLLEKPPSFGGRREEWRRWRVKFTTWLSGIEARYERALADAEALVGMIPRIDPDGPILVCGTHQST